MAEELKEVVPNADINAALDRLGREISACYAGGEPVVAVCVLKGAYMFFADLVRRIKAPLRLDFVRLASYGDATSSGDLVFSKDVETSLAGRHVLIVEDIVDTGRSMDFLKRTFEERGPASVRIAALVDKYERREVELTVDFPAFTLEEGFLVGYGMDHAEKFRELDAIYELVQDGAETSL